MARILIAEDEAGLRALVARALHVDLSRHPDGCIVAVVAPAQRPAKRIGLVIGARLTHLSRPTGAGTLPHHALLLHLLRQVLCASAQRLEGPPL